jgi:glycosyltransferase involved in cell wall biosynthesis
MIKTINRIQGWEMPQDLKILLVVSSIELGGGERVVLTLASGLSDLGIHVEIAGPQEGELLWAFKKVCKAYHPFNFYPTKIPEFTRLVADGGFDVVHTHLFGADLFGLLAARRSGVPCVVATIHGPTYIYDFSLRHRLQAALYRMAYVPAHAIVCVSEWVKNDFFSRSGLKLSTNRQRQIRVIPNCLPIMLETNDCYIPPPHSGPTILSVGEFHPIKGQILLAKAGLKVISEIPEARFVMIGKEAHELDKIKKLVSDAQKQDSFIFPGQVNVGTETYRAATLTVVPSIYEGFGLVAFESMNAGTPTLVSNGGALTEVTGDAACTFPAGDKEMFAQSILQLLRDKHLRERLKTVGLKRVKHFPREQFINSYLDLYQQVLNSSSVGQSTA